MHLLLVLALFFGGNLQSQKIIRPIQNNQKVKILKLRPLSFSIAPFVVKYKSEEFDYEWEELDIGTRFLIYPAKPDFFFVYFDAYSGLYTENYFGGSGPSVISKQKIWGFEPGFGVAGSLPIWKWGLGLDGEVTIPIPKFTPTIALGLSWNYKEKFSFSVFNLITLNQPGILNLGFGGQWNF